MRTQLLFALLATVLAYPFLAAPVNAQSIRTFVSTAGSDNPSCSLASPCRHFQAAVNATAAGGEVDALDAGAYGSFTISHAITIEGQGWSYVAPPANGNAITINATTSDNINIHGVSLNGVGTTFTSGILFNSGGRLNIRDSVIQNFTQNGIFCSPNTSTLSQLYVSNTLVSDNGKNGIEISSGAGTGTTNGVLDHVQIENNAQNGLYVITNTETINVIVSDSVSANNGESGIVAFPQGVAPVNIMVRNSTIANNNGIAGLEADESGATIRVTRSTITGNFAGWATAGAGVVSTFGDNDIFGNGSANNAPTPVGHE
jgi:hypothetical protein